MKDILLVTCSCGTKFGTPAPIPKDIVCPGCRDHPLESLSGSHVMLDRYPWAGPIMPWEKS